MKVLAVIAVLGLAGVAPAQAESAPAPLLITVVEKATGAPIAGAEVRVAREEDFSESPDACRRDWTTVEREAWSDSTATVFRTGKDGTVGVPRTGGSMIVTARAAGGLFAKARVDLGDPLRLELEPDESREIEVIDASGAPAGGVAVALVTVGGPGNSSLVLWSGASNDRTGVAVIEHWQRVRRIALDFMSRGSGERPTRIAVSAMLATSDPPLVLVDLAKTRVRLVLPQTRPLTVRVIDSSGRPVTDRCAVRIWSDALTADRQFRFVHTRDAVETSNGEAKFARVGDRAVVEIEVTSTHGRFPDTRRTIPLDEAAWRTKRQVVTVETKAARTTLVGTITEAGRRRDAKPVLLLLTQDGSYRDGAFVITDGDGRFRYPLGWNPTGSKGMVLQALLDDRRKATVAIPPDQKDGDVDLGEIEIRAHPVAVAGRVVDSAGRPVLGVRVQIETRQDETQTDDRGAFIFHETLAAGPWELTAVRDGWVGPQHVPFVPGTTDVVVRMSRAASVRGRVTLPPGDARVEVTPRGPAAAGPPRITSSSDWISPSGSGRVNPDGSFGWTGLLPGRLEVAVSIDGVEQKSLATAVDVAEGEDAAPPALNTLRVAERCRRYEVTVVDVAGRPVEDARVAYAPLVPYHVDRTTDERGKVSFVAADSRPSIGAYRSAEKGRKGYRPVVVTAEGTDVDVVLDERIPLTVSMNGGVKPPPAGLGFYVSTGPEGPQDESVAWAGFRQTGDWIEPGGSVDVGCAFPGKYALGLTVADRDEPLFFNALLGAPVHVDVKEGSTDPVRFSVTQDQIDAAVRDVKAKKKEMGR